MTIFVTNQLNSFRNTDYANKVFSTHKMIIKSLNCCTISRYWLQNNDDTARWQASQTAVMVSWVCSYHFVSKPEGLV